MSTPSAHPMRTALLLVAAFGSGVLVALQSRINGQLGLQLGDGFVAAFISFGSGFVILVIASVFWRPGRRGLGQVVAAVRERRIPRWYLTGGAAGAFFVLTQSLVVGLIGVALFTVGVVAGQTTSSLLIDRRGIGTLPSRAISWPRLVGAALAVVAVILAASPEVRGALPLWFLVAPFLVGAGVGWQGAANSQVRGIAGSAFTATFINFALGVLVLMIAAVIHLSIAGWPTHLPTTPWLYLGGVIGCVFIGAQAVIVRRTGVLVMGLAVLSGQLVTAVLFDVIAPVQAHAIAPITIVGAALTLIAVLIAAIPMRRQMSAPAQAPSGANPSASEFMQ